MYTHAHVAEPHDESRETYRGIQSRCKQQGI